MFARTLSLWPLYVAIVASLAACSLNPQPEPPMNDLEPGSFADANTAGAGGAGTGGRGGAAGAMAGSGGVVMDASQFPESAPPGDEGGCFDCNCACTAAGADGSCETGPQSDADLDANCPCEAGAEAGIDGEVDAGNSDVDPTQDAAPDAVIPD